MSSPHKKARTASSTSQPPPTRLPKGRKPPEYKIRFGYVSNKEATQGRSTTSNWDQSLPTTNHLESFNGILKRKYLRWWQRGGKCLQLDVLIKLLVIEILPSIFEQCRLEMEEGNHIKEWIISFPGGQQLWEKRQTRHTVLPPVVYLSPDTTRDTSAAQLLKNNQISVPTLSGECLQFTCYSSFATELDDSPFHTVCHFSIL